MNKNLLILSVNDHAKIIMRLNHPNDMIEASYQVRFIWKNYNHERFLTYNFLSSEMETLKILLNMALKNELQLDSSYTKNIGYYWNYCINMKNATDRFGDDYSILKEYFIMNSIFLYNDLQGNIILEIAALYPDTYVYGKKKRSYNFFLNWMKIYKPVFKQIIPQELAQQWIDQATQILTIIDKNTEELYAQGKL